MENMNAKTGNSNLNTTSKTNRLGEGVSEPDILRRAYEIYLENSINFSDELWELLRGQTSVKEPRS
jgi:hypothetical protein